MGYQLAFEDLQSFCYDRERIRAESPALQDES